MTDPHRSRGLGLSKSDSWTESVSIKVGVRVRPLTAKELTKPPVRSRGGPGVHFRHRKDSSDACAWNVSGNNNNTLVQKSARRVQGRSVFTFDNIFQQAQSTQQVYDSMMQPIVSGVAAGQNGTMLCYGQTGSGKSYTMQGETTAKDGDGIIQMVATDLFRDINEKSTDRDFSVSVSYIEIYNEKVRDLLLRSDNDETSKGSRRSRTSNGSGLGVREDPKRGGVYVNSKEWQVHDAAGVVNALEEGSKNRASSPTSMNYQSSRSHAIFRIKVESRAKETKATGDDIVDGRVVRVASLNLVDLAGSENGHQSGPTLGSRQREGGKINQSLLSLSQVIHALSVPPDRRPAYINYRNSKLTRILQPYLSGNALIAVLCCITPSRLYVEETRSTLKFATRAKLVTTKPQLNEVMDDTAMIKKLQNDLEKARRDIERLEKREETNEKETKEAMHDFKKLKSMIYGGSALPEFQTVTPPPGRPHRQAEPSLKNAVIIKPKELTPVKETELSMTSDTTGTPLWGDGSHSAHQKSDYGPKVNRTVPVSPSPAPPCRDSRLRQQPLPSEVIILREPVPSPLRVENQSVDRSELINVQERAEFLGAKLDATEDLVESLFKDLESARGCIHQLVFRNISLAKIKHTLERKLQELAESRDERMIQQYTLLKFSMYIGLLFFLYGNHELYFAAVMFVWLTLEAVTCERHDYMYFD